MSSNGASAAPAGTLAQAIRWRGGAFSHISRAPKYGKYGLLAGKGYAPIWFSKGRGMCVIALFGGANGCVSALMFDTFGCMGGIP